MFYGVVILGIVLGGLVLLVTFSLLVMARKGEEFYDQLKMEPPLDREYAPPMSKKGQPENLGTSGIFDLPHGSIT